MDRDDLRVREHISLDLSTTAARIAAVGSGPASDRGSKPSATFAKKKLANDLLKYDK